jgi:IPT/TIG domain
MTVGSRICACAVMLATAAACGGSSAVGPTPAASTSGTDAPVVERITPRIGSISGTRVTITGRGFRSGATVVIEEAAVKVVVVNSGMITALTPVLTKEINAADVIVINPDERSGRLAAAFRYASFSIASSAAVVTANAPLSVTWKTSAAGPSDWIGLFKKDSPNTSYNSGWFDYTSGAASGTFTLAAPAAPGEYEFRYLLDDDFNDTTRSGLVTVVAER